VTTEPSGSLLRVRGLSKNFGSVRALDRVDLDIGPGEVRALVGQNGSGKSTLIKILAGVHQPGPGSRIEFGDQAYPPGDMKDLADQIRFLHQDLGLILEMSVAENLAIRTSVGRTRLGGLKMADARSAAADRIAPFGVEIDAQERVQNLTPVQRTIVALAAALPASASDTGRRLVVLDEPTAALPPHEVEILLGIVSDLAARGFAVLYVSHRLDEVFEVAHRVTVLRNGRVIATRPVEELTRSGLIELMIGERTAGRSHAGTTDAQSPVCLEAVSLTGRYLRDASLSLRAGEILGIAGMPGSGSHDIPYCIAGALGAGGGGYVRLPAISRKWTDVRRLRRSQLPIVPADRLHEGIVRGFSVRENLTLSVLGTVSRASLVSGRRERVTTSRWFERLALTGATRDSAIEQLSGGNQQKVVLGRCLAAGGPVVTLCEPTAGVDVHAREAIYELIVDAARNGMSFVVASSDISDLLAICGRVLVIRDGVVAKELTAEAITESAILHEI
jgi:ABC-type sugar transport system ATPase subunit